MSVFQFGDVLAAFTVPEQIGATWQSLLLALPLLAVISIVYKAIKLEEIRAADFLKQTFLLFGSIVVFMIIAAVIIFAVMKAVIG